MKQSRTAYHREHYRKNAEKRRQQRLESHQRLGLAHKYIIQMQGERRRRRLALRTTQSQEHPANGQIDL